MQKKCGRNTNTSKRPRQVELAWAAGILDGEGCIHFSVFQPPNRPSAKYRVIVTIQMVHLPTLEKIQEMLGGTVRPIDRKANKGNRRDIWRWTVTCREAGEVLTLLLPYLVTKQPEAQIALEYFANPRTKPSRRGRSAEETASLSLLCSRLKDAKRYEWKHPNR